MCHHKAFMDAFVKYINRSKKFVGEIISDSTNVVAESCNNSLTTNWNNETCRIETLSSVTHDGCGTITISIGSST